MDDVQKLGIEINAILKELGSMRQLAEDLKRIKENAGLADEKVAQFQKRVEKMRNLRESFQSLNIVGAQMMAMGGGVLFAFKKMATGFVNAAVEAEQYELTLTTLFKSVEKAKAELAWAEKFEVMTPYALKDIIQATVTFRSFGLDAKKYLGMAGDLAASFPSKANAFESAIMGVAKAMASGAGAMDILNQSFGITGDQLRKLGWKGKGDLEGFRKALEKFLTMKYGGAMKKVMDTLPANIEGIRSEWDKFQKMVGKPLLEKITPDVRKLYGGIVKLAETGELKKWAKVVSDLFLGIYDAIKKAITAVVKFIKPFVDFFAENPEFAKLAGQVLLIGSALTFAGGGALVLTGIIGQSIVSVMSLVGHLGGLKVALYGVGQGLGIVGTIGASAFVGWKLGEIIGELTVGGKKINEWVQGLIGILFFRKQLEGEDAGTEKAYKRDLERIQSMKKMLTESGKLTVPIAIAWQDYENLLDTMPKTYAEMLERIEDLEQRYLRGVGKKLWLGTHKIAPEGEGWLKEVKDMGKKVKEELDKIMAGDLGISKPDIDFGLTTPYEITAETRPEITTNYYTIHFERDAVQINTLEITPEKFARAFKEFLSRQALGPVTP